MTEINPREVSYSTDNHTERSPTHNRRQTHHTNVNFEIYCLKEEYHRDLQNCHRQIDLLKEELLCKNQEIQHLNVSVILKLKTELNEAHKQKIKHFQESQSTRKQLERLRSDNASLQSEVEKSVRDRRAVASKIEELKELKEVTKRQISQNQKILRELKEQNRRLERQIGGLKAQLQETLEELQNYERRMLESDGEYKIMLQKNFAMESELRSLQFRHKDHQTLVHSYKQKIQCLQSERQELLEQVQRQGSGRELQFQGVQKMTEVKALMNEIYSLVEEKGQSKFLANKFEGSMRNLGNVMRKK